MRDPAPAPKHLASDRNNQENRAGLVIADGIQVHGVFQPPTSTPVTTPKVAISANARPLNWPENETSFR